MECNKEEAIRARGIAEAKTNAGDFLGAQKLAMKAQRLCPSLENISQLITVCEVHCSAQNKILGLDNWYGILQVERFADEATVRKQYRKLALVLHPDKNKFAGAEAAFKLIGEANRVLSDQTKRSQYDQKLRAFSQINSSKSTPMQTNMSSIVKKHTNNASQNNPPEHTLNATFWTCCRYCGMRYKYLREHVNKILRCQTCQKSFPAVDIGFEFSNHRSLFTSKQVPSQRASKAPPQNDHVKPSGIPHSVRSTGSSNVSRAGTMSEACRGSVSREKVVKNDLRTKKNDVVLPKTDTVKPGSAEMKSKTDLTEEKSEVTAPKSDETKGSKNKNRKRKVAEESSENLEGDDKSNEDDVTQENGVEAAGQNSCGSGEIHKRKSSRQKRQVSYMENGSDDDFVSPPAKRSKASRSSDSDEQFKGACISAGFSKSNDSSGSDICVDTHEKETKQKVTSGIEETLSRSDENKEASKEKVEGAATEERRELDNASELKEDVSLDKIVMEYPDPEFSDFEKDKKVGCFAVNQVWAIYDTTDGMPRFYARIRKIFFPGFKLKITWLEPISDNLGEQKWIDEAMPVGCGKYENGETDEIEDHLMLSHQMPCVRNSSRRTYIYPRRGEIWALFKGWDIGWSSDPGKQKPPYQYEFVQVLSDFSENIGIGVHYLRKVKGFVCLFQKAAQDGVLAFHIPPVEMYRFSHRIPAFEMTGKEREGVPIGSFELDPPALPMDLFELGDADNMKFEKQSLHANRDSLQAENPTEVKQTMTDSERVCRPMKYEKTNPDGEVSKSSRPAGAIPNGMCGNQYRIFENCCPNDKNINRKESVTSCLDDEKINTPEVRMNNQTGEAFNLRRSPRCLSEKGGQVNENQCMAQGVDKHLGQEKQDTHGFPVHTKGNASSRGLGVADNDITGFTDPKSVTPSSLRSKNTEENSFDFKMEKSKDKFKINQIWAIYSTKDGMPKEYVLIKKIQNMPDFRLHVALLEPYSSQRNTVFCGVYKVRSAEIKTLPQSSFSHRVRDLQGEKNTYEIYPRKGEIWALYKNENSTRSDPCEFDIVEVLEDSGRNLKIAVLTCINMSKSLYRAPRSQRATGSVIDVPRSELDRFSHQIPAFQHTGLKDRFRGLWELDRLAIPGMTIILD